MEIMSGFEIVTLEGALTIRRAAEVRDLMMKHLGESGDLVLDLSSGTDFDWTFMQSLLALGRSCQSKEKRLFLLEGWPDQIDQLIEASGVSGLPPVLSRATLTGSGEEGKTNG